jgi:polysaccharide biosynthesis/export protein
LKRSHSPNRSNPGPLPRWRGPDHFTAPPTRASRNTGRVGSIDEEKMSLRHVKSLMTATLLTMLVTLFPLHGHAQEYVINSEDVLKISVFEYPDLATEARVGEEGKITFPLLGEIKTKGLTTRQVEKAIAAKLVAGKIVKNPQVSVFVEQYRGRKVTILGEVVKPGQYDIPGKTSLLDLLSQALGTSQSAGYQLTIFRKEAGPDGTETTQKIMVDVDRLLNGGDLSQNVELKNGDTVYVPKAVFYIYGEVNRPGAYRVERGITVKRAIALAGGLTPKGSLRRMEITRKEGEKEKTASASIDEMVATDDVVRIKESIF